MGFVKNIKEIIRLQAEGKELYDSHYSDTRELSEATLMSGVLMLVRKSVWRKIKFRSGFLGVDNWFHKDCVANKLKVYVMEGVYIYHWYRGDGDLSHISEYFDARLDDTAP